MNTILQNHYVLAVHDVRASAAFYVDVLDFSVVAEPPGWTFVCRDNCMVMLGECPDDLPPAELGCHSYFAYLWVDDADAWYAQCQARGADCLGKIEDKSWGMREFGIRTPDGHRLMIGQKISIAD